MELLSVRVECEMMVIVVFCSGKKKGGKLARVGGLREKGEAEKGRQVQ